MPDFDESTAVYKNFSGENAFVHLEKIVGIGPRISGSEGLAKSRQYIVDELEKIGWGVKIENFKSTTPAGEIEFFNIRARFSAERKPVVWDHKITGLICSHYDTKKFSSFEFVGANDGGSSTAALIEIARVLAKRPEVASELELVWFDGEEAIGTNITDTDGLVGSRVYATQWSLIPAKKRPDWGLLLDMIGDNDLKIRTGIEVSPPPLADRDLEGEIDFGALLQTRRKLANQLIQAADAIGHRQQFGISPNYITDDHVPLNNTAGIPTIDIIDFDFDYWHTPGDNLDKISAESLEIVGQATILLIEKYLLQDD